MKAYIRIRENLRDEKREMETQSVGCAYVTVIDGEKIVEANMGDYRAVVYKDGLADQICEKHHPRIKRRWSLNVFSGKWFVLRSCGPFTVLYLLTNHFTDELHHIEQVPCTCALELLALNYLSTQTQFCRCEDRIHINGIWQVSTLK